MTQWHQNWSWWNRPRRHLDQDFVGMTWVWYRSSFFPPFLLYPFPFWLFPSHSDLFPVLFPPSPTLPPIYPDLFPLYPDLFPLNLNFSQFWGLPLGCYSHTIANWVHVNKTLPFFFWKIDATLPVYWLQNFQFHYFLNMPVSHHHAPKLPPPCTNILFSFYTSISMDNKPYLQQFYG